MYFTLKSILQMEVPLLKSILQYLPLCRPSFIYIRIRYTQHVISPKFWYEEVTTEDKPHINYRPHQTILGFPKYSYKLGKLCTGVSLEEKRQGGIQRRQCSGPHIDKAWSNSTRSMGVGTIKDIVRPNRHYNLKTMCF